MSTQHLVSVDDLAIDQIRLIMALSAEYAKRLDKKERIEKILEDMIVATIFVQPSTRTRLSFESATIKLGGHVISAPSAATDSSLAKGESIEDCIKTVQEYANLIVMRHPLVGSAARAAAVSTVPIINAGDGIGEHPSQTLLDIYTIEQRLHRSSGLNIAIAGDLCNGRTTHSLIKNLSLDQSNQFYFISPPELSMPGYLRDRLVANGNRFEEATCYREFLPKMDVFYMTRIQREYMEPEEYEKCQGIYTLDTAEASMMKHNSIIMHPLPRVDEITIAVDGDHRCAYFDQVRNGLHVRMALLEVMLAR